MESNLGRPGKIRKLMIWTSWPADCLASWLAGWRSLVKPGLSPGDVFGVSVKEFFEWRAIWGALAWLVGQLAGWRSLVEPGLGPGEVLDVSVKEICYWRAIWGAPGKIRKLMIWTG